MAIDYNDQRFAQVENEKQQQMNQLESQYNGMINNSDSYYQGLIDETNRYKTQQEELQQQRTDQAINEINQQKQFAEQDYQKEQRGSYADYQKQLAGSSVSNMAAGHEFGGGYSESSQVGMYNTYQNRLATAKDSFNKAVINYNNQITQAQLANNSALAEIAHNALQQQLELSLQGFQYKNQLTIDLLNQKQNLSNTYWNRYRDVESQINTENSLAEEIRQYNAKMAEEQRQYNEKMAYQRERDAVADAQWQKEYDLAKKKVGSSGGSGGSGGGPYVTVTQDPTYKPTDAPKDYYFDNGYQPKYLVSTDKNGNNTYIKLEASTIGGNKITTSQTGLDSKYGSGKTVWYANGDYWVWANKNQGYVKLTGNELQNVKNLKSSKNTKYDSPIGPGLTEIKNSKGGGAGSSF